MNTEKMIKIQNDVRDKLLAGIKRAEARFGVGTAYIEVNFIVWDYEMEPFIEYAEQLAEQGHVLAVSQHGTNFAEIVIGLTEHGWTNDEVLDVDYGGKAVTFKK